LKGEYVFHFGLAYGELDSNPNSFNNPPIFNYEGEFIIADDILNLGSLGVGAQVGYSETFSFGFGFGPSTTNRHLVLSPRAIFHLNLGVKGLDIFVGGQYALTATTPDSVLEGPFQHEYHPSVLFGMNIFIKNRMGIFFNYGTSYAASNIGLSVKVGKR